MQWWESLHTAGGYWDKVETCDDIPWWEYFLISMKVRDGFRVQKISLLSSLTPRGQETWWMSDFTIQQDGYLALFCEECELATHVPQTSWIFLEYGGDKESYWTGVKLIANVWIQCNYQPQISQRTRWLFDQSCCHYAYGEDALNARKIKVHPGGAQPRMRDTN